MFYHQLHLSRHRHLCFHYADSQPVQTACCSVFRHHRHPLQSLFLNCYQSGCHGLSYSCYQLCFRFRFRHALHQFHFCLSQHCGIYLLPADVCPFHDGPLHALQFLLAVPVHTFLNHYTGHVYQLQHHDICSLPLHADVFLFHALYLHPIKQYQSHKNRFFFQSVPGVPFFLPAPFCFYGHPQLLSVLLQQYPFSPPHQLLFLHLRFPLMFHTPCFLPHE